MNKLPRDSGGLKGFLKRSVKALIALEVASLAISYYGYHKLNTDQGTYSLALFVFRYLTTKSVWTVTILWNWKHMLYLFVSDCHASVCLKFLIGAFVFIVTDVIHCSVIE